MHLFSAFSTALRRRTRGVALLATCAVVIASLSALPTAPAQASEQPTPSITLPVAVSSVPQEQLETLLGQLPLGKLDAAEVGKAVAELPGLSLLPTGKLEAAVAKAVEALAGEGKTLQSLLTPGEAVSGLETELKGLLSPLELLNLLNGQSLTTLLSSALGSLSAGEVVGTLLDNAAKPEALLGELLGALDAGKLESLLGSPLGSTSFVPGTAGTLAGELNTTTEALATELGINPVQLPALSLALTGVLPNGTMLGALDGLEGLSLGLFTTKTGEGTEGGQGGSGGSGSGGTGGLGGSGGGGSPGSGSGTGNPGDSAGGTGGGTTVVVNYLPPTGPPAASAASATGRIRIVSHKVTNGVARVVVQVPGAGDLTLSGAGVRIAHGHAGKAGLITLSTRLTRALRARHGKRHARSVRLTALFAPLAGTKSSAGVTVRFAR